MENYTVTAQNFSSETENKIHNDKIAKRYGFTGALVPGVAVYGHLTYPLVAAQGEHWLSHSVSSVRFFKPAYHGDSLSIQPQSNGDETVVGCYNGSDVELAQLRTEQPNSLPPIETFSMNDSATKSSERVEMNWETVVPDIPFQPWQMTLEAETNLRYCTQIRDNLPIYQKLVHPHWLLSLANTALTREYVMPAWIHVGSEIRHRAAVNVGDTLTIYALPLEKWQTKGHEFIRLYLRYCCDSRVTTEIFHTAIFKVAPVS